MTDNTNANSLSNNNAGGDIAGGNIDKSTTVINATIDSPLRKKMKEMQLDALDDDNFVRYMKEFCHFFNPINPNDQRDLSAKLMDANRKDEIFEAESLKEEFAKTLMKNNLSEQAQDAYVHILAKIKTLYESKVKPHIKENAALTDIEDGVFEVIEIIYGDLVGTIFEKDHRKIKGMLYFLTGNCHIDWRYQ